MLVFYKELIFQYLRLFSTLCSFLQLEIFTVESFPLGNELFTHPLTLQMQTWLTLSGYWRREEGAGGGNEKKPQTLHLFHRIDNLICAYPTRLQKVCLSLRATLLLYQFPMSSSIWNSLWILQTLGASIARKNNKAENLDLKQMENW